MPPRWSLPLALASAAPIALVFVWLELAYGGMARENGPMENLQVVCLLLGAILLGMGLIVRSCPGSKWFLGVLALGYLSVIVLEVDTRSSTIRWLVTVFNSWVRDLWLGSLWLIASCFLVRYRREIFLHLRAWWPMTAGRIFATACVFWVLGGVIDKTYRGPHRFLIEEVLEVAGAYLMLLAAWFSSRRPPFVTESASSLWQEGRLGQERTSDSCAGQPPTR